MFAEFVEQQGPGQRRGRKMPLFGGTLGGLLARPRACGPCPVLRVLVPTYWQL
jgi:hypothetical protein